MQKPGFAKRALRRTALARKKRQARKIYPHDTCGRTANHLKVCSCHMCGNPRKHWNQLSMQELRAEAAARAGLAEALA